MFRTITVAIAAALLSTSAAHALEAADTTEDLEATELTPDELEAADTTGDLETTEVSLDDIDGDVQLVPDCVPISHYTETSARMGASDMGVLVAVDTSRIKLDACEADTMTSAVLTATATVFGRSVDALGMGLRTRADGTLSYRADLDLMGTTVARVSSAEGDHEDIIDQTLFSASTRVSGVRVTGELTASAGLRSEGRQSGDEIEVLVEPFAGLTMSARAGAGLLCVSVGVGADVSLGELSMPIVLNSSPTSSSISGSLDYSIGDGRVYAYVEYCLDEERVTLASWDGASASQSLF